MKDYIIKRTIFHTKNNNDLEDKIQWSNLQ